ncbi:hypothetical protein PVAP13_5NG192081 [Panicum virgatum]|uniref:magnesium-protoporphyrin IX monomethyl ester (oxidative) cyclase n=1 Tax=Panicum virgatum TaxID=38727 RepID=A0A8T0RNY6_PANVG|nr:hypothetical protein PVAP13_5NG192081 [Panicum virgatum]
MASSAMELSLLNPAAMHHRASRPAAGLPLARRSAVRFRVSASAAAAAPPKSSGPKKRGKTEIQETLLTPRFYTTDFDEMERLFNAEINKQLNQAEFDALAAGVQDGLQPDPLRAQPRIFSLMSRDEARHAGFLNKGLSDFNLALDLGFLTKARKYTFFKPKFIFYATYLSEKIGYWRYITIFRHLKANPEYQVYPIFKYFENWCQDENRHGDFFSALLKAQPQFLNDWKAKLWSRFFCLSVYVTMYLNDCQRTTFYEGIGLDTKEFDMHVIIETNRTTARIFPAVLDVENPEFKRKLDKMVEINQKIIAIGESGDIPLVKNLKRIPLVAALVSEIIAAYLMPPIESGSVDFAEFEPQLVY